MHSLRLFSIIKLVITKDRRRKYVVEWGAAPAQAGGMNGEKRVEKGRRLWSLGAPKAFGAYCNDRSQSALAIGGFDTSLPLSR